MPICLMQCGKETLPLLKKMLTVRSRIDEGGDDWDHYNSYLMVSTIVFVVFE